MTTKPPADTPTAVFEPDASPFALAAVFAVAGIGWLGAHCVAGWAGVVSGDAMCCPGHGTFAHVHGCVNHPEYEAAAHPAPIPAVEVSE